MNHISRSKGVTPCAAFNGCHPERSLSASEAGRQTQSEHPYDRDAAGGQSGNFRVIVRFFDEQASLKSLGIALLLAILAFAAWPLMAQTSARFPGSKPQLHSPNGRYIIQNVNQEQNPQHAILLKDEATGNSRKVYEYGRGVGVVWSPDSRHFAVNDYVGSNVTQTSIFSIDEPSQQMDVQEAIFHFDTQMQKRVKVVGWGHDYFGVARWLDAQRVVVHHWGHTDEPSGRAFCDCYIYNLQGSVARCSRQPKTDDPETLCGEITP